jgi:galactokinase
VVVNHDLIEKGKQLHYSVFGQEAQAVIRVPGRINLLGEHTDYNGGTVLPGCIEQAIYFHVNKNQSNTITLFNSYDNKKHTLGSGQQTKDWTRFLQQAITVRDGKIPGLDITITSDLPIGAGLSSSSALTSGFIQILSDNHFLPILPTAEQKIQWAVESEHGTGVIGGTMDQTAIFHAEEGNLLNLQCQENEFELLPFDSSEVDLVLLNSNQTHELINTDYNRRADLCRRAVSLLKDRGWKGHYLVDCDHKNLKVLAELMKPSDLRKVEYVIQEDKRVQQAIRQINKHSWENLGKLMTVTHWGLSHAFEVSTSRIDKIVQLLCQYPQVYGARIMGGGFGGCILMLSQKNEGDEFYSKIKSDIELKMGFTPSIYPVNLSQGLSYIKGIY